MKRKKCPNKKLYTKISDQTGLDKSETKKIVQTIFSLIKTELINGNEITIPKFGKFRIISVNSKTYHDAISGTMKTSTPRKRVRFTMCKELKSILTGVQLWNL